MQIWMNNKICTYGFMNLDTHLFGVCSHLYMKDSSKFFWWPDDLFDGKSNISTSSMAEDKIESWQTWM